MPIDVIMPELGETVVEGTIAKWLKKVGDSVKEDEEIVEIITDKVNTTLPAPASGILAKIIAVEGDVVPVAKAIAVILLPGESTADIATAVTETIAPAKEKISIIESADEVEAETRRFSPVVRSIAKKHGIPTAHLERLSGTGIGGRLTKNDLLNYLASQPEPANPQDDKTISNIPVSASVGIPFVSNLIPPEPQPANADEVYQLTGLRKIIADQMTKSYNVPQVSTVIPVDMTRLWEYRNRNKEAFERDYGIRLTFTPFFVKATAEALKAFPNLNATIEDTKVTLRGNVNIGVAVALGEKGEGGLIVPVIRSADTKSLLDIARELEYIAKRARRNALEAADVQGGSFTLTNPGSYGAVFGTPIINAPQTGILGTYAIIKQPVAVEDMIAIRSMMNLVLTYDHRLVDGMYAGRFLQKIRELLEKAEFFS